MSSGIDEESGDNANNGDVKDGKESVSLASDGTTHGQASDEVADGSLNDSLVDGKHAVSPLLHNDVDDQEASQVLDSFDSLSKNTVVTDVDEVSAAAAAAAVSVAASSSLVEIPGVTTGNGVDDTTSLVSNPTQTIAPFSLSLTPTTDTHLPLTDAMDISMSDDNVLTHDVNGGGELVPFDDINSFHEIGQKRKRENENENEHEHEHENDKNRSDHSSSFNSISVSSSSSPSLATNQPPHSHTHHRSSIVTTVKPQLTYVPLKTGLCYDVRMRYHSRIVTSPYDYVDPHPEDPRRIYRVYKAIAEAGLITDPNLQGVDDLGPLVQKIPVREATAEEILLVHTQNHLDFIESTTTMPRERLIEETEKGDSIYLNNDSYMAAKLSCGGSIEACRAVVERRVKNSIAIVRPPGHHAEPKTPGGFCLFSNVAVAAKAVLRDYPESVRRILVVDWDVHHGNGTQRAFLDDDRVLYISLHRYEGGRFYPGTDFGAHTVVGEGAGRGYSVNIPWSTPGMGDGDYIYAFHKVIMPLAIEFDPDLVIVSAGFDAAEGDLIGGCLVSPNGYGYMTHLLKSLANGHLVVILEGGYSLSAIANSALAVTKVLLGEPCGVPKTKRPTSSAIRVIDDVIKVQSQFWKSLKPEINVVNLGESERHVRLADAIRGSLAQKLVTKHDFSILPILNDNLPMVQDSQLLASPKIHTKEKLIIIVHDAPQVWADRDPITGSINPNKSLVIDSTEKFIQYGLENDYGILDINIPGDSDIMDSNSSYSIVANSQETLTYVWDNYFEYFDAKHIIFVGTGDAYAGIVHLAGHREIRERTDAIVCFIGDISLKPITPVIDEYVTDWFFRSSLIFTSKEHPAWDSRLNPKRPRKKFGRVIQSDSISVYDVIEERFEEATEFIEELIEGEEEE